MTNSDPSRRRFIQGAGSLIALPPWNHWGSGVMLQLQKSRQVHLQSV